MHAIGQPSIHNVDVYIYTHVWSPLKAKDTLIVIIQLAKEVEHFSMIVEHGIHLPHYFSDKMILLILCGSCLYIKCILWLACLVSGNNNYYP